MDNVSNYIDREGELVPECENSCVLRVQSAAEQSFAASVLGIQESFAQTVARFTQGQGLLSGRWTGGETWDAKAAPARTSVGGGGVGDSWKAAPSTDPWWRRVFTAKIALTPSVAAVRAIVERELKNSPAPIALVNLANIVVAEKPDAGPASQWAGMGSFKALLERLAIPDLTLRTDISPGFAYLEDVHAAPVATGSADGTGESVEPAIALRVSEAVGIPRLSSEQYAALFTAIEEYFGGQADFELSRTRLVRDAVAARGYPVSRHAVNYVVKGIYLSGHDFNADVAQDASTLALAFLANVKKLIRQEGMELAANDETALELWLTGATSSAETAVALDEDLDEDGADVDVPVSVDDDAVRGDDGSTGIAEPGYSVRDGFPGESGSLEPSEELTERPEPRDDIASFDTLPDVDDG